MDAAFAALLGFWAIAAAMTAGALAVVLLPLLVARAPRPGVSAAAVNLEVFRRQAAELEQDLAGGALSDADYRDAKADLERRLLADGGEDRPGTPPAAARSPARALAASSVAVLLPALAFGLYALFGAPAALQEESAASASLAATATDTPETLRARLAAHVERHPRDGRAFMLLARLDFAADRYAAAAASYERALAVSTKVARDPVAWCEYADALGMAQGGSLAGKPSELVAHALTLDPNNSKALEMAGSAAFEQNDPAAAAGYWRQLLAQLPPLSPERRELTVAVARAEELAAPGSHPKAGSQ